MCDGFICENGTGRSAQRTGMEIPINALRSAVARQANQTKITSNCSEPYWNAFWFSGDIGEEIFLVSHFSSTFPSPPSRHKKTFLLSLTLKQNKSRRKKTFTVTFGWDNFSSSKARPNLCVTCRLSWQSTARNLRSGSPLSARFWHN